MQQSKVDASLHAGFLKPNPEFSPVPIWWWSGDTLDVPRMRWQIDQLVSQGVHNAVVLNLAPTGPTHGSLSDWPHMATEDWWGIWESLCDHSEKVGMRLWFYDQIGFSGANLQGKLAVENSSFVGMALERVVTDVEGDGEVICPEAGIFIAAQAIPLAADGIVAGPPAPVEVKDRVARWSGKSKVRLMIAYALRKGFDYHSPEACAKLIDTVHGEFERRLKPYFGKSLVGSFQDELPSVPSWSARFSSEFKRRCGYAIEPAIAALWEDWGLESARIRIDYQRVRAALAEEALFKPLFDWHERHGLTFGVDQQSPARAAEPLSTVDQYADYARTHRWYSAPGSDHWGDAKFHSSLAHSYGRPRTWIECFHSSGWGGTLEETFDWLQPWLLAGANLYDPHAVYYSTKGGQWEWAAPSTCWRQPYWRHYKHFADAVSRICWLATRGEHVCDIGVLFPSASVQADIFLDHAGEKARGAHSAYMALLGSMIWFNTRKGVLPKMLRDFDVLDDDTVAGASIERGALKTRAERYKAIIVPSSWLLEAGTLEKLIAFAEAGGLLIFVGTLPESTDRGDRDSLVDRLRALADRKLIRMVPDGPELAASLVRALAPIDPAIVADGPTLLRKVGDVSILFATAAPEGSATRQPMLPWAIWDYDHDVFSIARYNTELRESGYDFDPKRNRRHATVRVAGPVGAIEQWDPGTGASKPAKVVRKGGLTEVAVDFSESPMVALVWSTSGETAAPPPETPASGRVLSLEGPWRSRIVPTLDNRHGDFTLPAKPGPLPVQAWMLDCREDERATPDPNWILSRDADGWRCVPVTDGPRAWQFGPVDASIVPSPLGPEHSGSLAANGWSELHYSLSRGIDHDYQHDLSLGPKARVPEPFWRVRKVKAGQSVQFRTMLPVPTSEPLTLAVAANGTKRVWWNGVELGTDNGAFLAMHDVKSSGAGLNLLEVRVTAVADDDLAGYWALTTDRESFERPEWLEPADGWKAGTTLRVMKTVEIAESEAFEAQFGSLGVATLLVNGREVAMHGAFEPYAGWRNTRLIKYALSDYVRPGENTIEVRFTDAGTPLAVYFDGIITAPGRNRPRSVVSDGDWRASREGRPVRLRFQPVQRNDPRYYMLRPRPHPLPRSGWLDPEQPIAGVLDIIPEPNPERPKRFQWFAIPVPPGAHRFGLPIHDAEVAAWLGERELHLVDSAADLPDGESPTRTLLVRVKAADGRLSGAVWDGPIEFQCGEGEIELGSWTDKGLAFYSGGLSYERAVRIDDPGEWSVLDLGKVRGTAEVELNGGAVGIRIWSPYRFDIAGKLRKGDNILKITVFNTLAPYLLGASPTHSIFKGQDISGLIGPVSLR